MRTLKLSLFKQSAEHLTVLIEVRLLNLRDLFLVSIDQTSHVRNTGTKFVQAICRTSDSIDPGETPHLRGLIRVCTDQTSHVRTLELSLFKQYAEHLTVLIQVRLLI